MRLRIVCTTNGSQNANVMGSFIVLSLHQLKQLLVVLFIIGIFSGESSTEKTPGAPCNASTQIPESSAIAGKPRLFWKHDGIFVKEFSMKVKRLFSAEGIILRLPWETTSIPKGGKKFVHLFHFFLVITC